MNREILNRCKQKQPVCITWRDSNVYMLQCSMDDDFEVETIDTYGFLIDVHSGKVVIAGDVLLNGDVRRVIVIPFENIVSVEVLGR